MRVLIDYRPALRERTGAGEYTHELVKALLALAHSDTATHRLELTLFSSSWKDRLVRTGELDGASAIDRRIPVRLLNYGWHRFGWPPAELLAGSFDVTHSSHPLMLPARRAAKVITIHDLHFLTHPERTRDEIRRDYPALIDKHARRADRIVVSSQFTAREVEHRLGVGAAKIVVCPHGAPAWQPRRQPPTDGYILFFGTLEPRKNVPGLLDAYERLIQQRPAEAGRHVQDGVSNRADTPDLVLAGRATEASRPWLERIARPPLAGRVRHLGYIDPERRLELYTGARLLVQPSFEEGFGIAVLEAMTLGVPVVASNRGSLPEVLGDAGPLVNPDDPNDLADAMSQLLNANYATACAEKGLIRARRFNWQETACRVYEMYRALSLSSSS